MPLPEPLDFPSPGAAAAPPTPQIEKLAANPIKPTSDPRSPLLDLPPHGSFEAVPHHSREIGIPPGGAVGDDER